MATAFCVDCGIPLTGRYCGACGRDYGATDAAQRASCPLATVQQDSSSTAGAQQEVAEAQQDVSSSTAGAQRAVSPASRPCAREGGGRAHGPRARSLRRLQHAEEGQERVLVQLQGESRQLGDLH